MNVKRFALLLSVLFAFGLFLASCGGSPSPSDGPSSDSPTPDDGPGGLEWPGGDTPKSISDPPAGAIDFSDGNLDFLALNLAPGDADPAILSVITHEGRSAMKVELTESKNPYLGIDVSSLYGDNVANIRKIEVRLWLENPDGTFRAASGVMEVYTGADNALNDFRWAVTMEKNNPTTIVAELGADMVFAPGAKNIVVIRKGTNADAAINAGERTSNLIIDYIACYDASGNIIPADTSASFNAPKGFGSADMSFLYEVTDEVKFSFMDDGKTGSGSGWGQAGAIDKENFDLDLLKPGAIITIGYDGPKAPEVVFQSWSDGPVGWAKVNPYMTNASGNIAQYRYEDIVEAFESDDFEEYLDRIYIGCRDCELDVKSFSIGQRTHEIEYKSILIGDDGFIDLTPLNVHANAGLSPGGWKQCFRVDTENSDENPGDFKPSWIVEGCYLIAYYESEKVTQFIFQRFSGGSEEIWGGITGGSRPGGYAAPEATDDSGARIPRLGYDMITYEGIMDMWAEKCEDKGGDPADFAEQLGAFWIQDDGAEYALFKIILYTPNP